MLSISRPVILTFLRHYLPGYKSGGPIQTIANLVDALGEEFDFRIVTSDRDATDLQPYEGLPETPGWVELGKAQILYLPPSARKFGRMVSLLRQTPHDALYLNSLFDPDFTLKPLLARHAVAASSQCIVAPRGECSPGALSLKSRKKRAFLAAAHLAGIYRGVCWQASSQHEEADIRKVFGARNKIRIAANLPGRSMPDWPKVSSKSEGQPLRICFLSRISPMKNLDYAIKVLKDVTAQVQFDIFGPVRDEIYWSTCQSLLQQLPANIEARYHGSIEHTQVSPTLAGHDLLFLPTLGENYGHVIIEALTAGTPVLIANTTPWRELAYHGVGWDLPLADMQAFRMKIDNMAAMPASERALLRQRAHEFALARMTDPEALTANRSLFRQAQS